MTHDPSASAIRKLNPALQGSDAVKFLELILSECSGGPNEHSWRKCRRCLAMRELEGHQPLARGFITRALAALATESKYFELIYAVGIVHRGESRHDTALRYIQEAETRGLGGPAALRSETKAIHD